MEKLLQEKLIRGNESNEPQIPSLTLISVLWVWSVLSLSAITHPRYHWQSWWKSKRIGLIFKRSDFLHTCPFQVLASSHVPLPSKSGKEGPRDSPVEELWRKRICRHTGKISCAFCWCWSFTNPVILVTLFLDFWPLSLGNWHDGGVSRIGYMTLFLCFLVEMFPFWISRPQCSYT